MRHRFEGEPEVKDSRAPTLFYWLELLRGGRGERESHGDPAERQHLERLWGLGSKASLRKVCHPLLRQPSE